MPTPKKKTVTRKSTPTVAQRREAAQIARREPGGRSLGVTGGPARAKAKVKVTAPKTPRKQATYGHEIGKREPRTLPTQKVRGAQGTLGRALAQPAPSRAKPPAKAPGTRSSSARPNPRAPLQGRRPRDLKELIASAKRRHLGSKGRPIGVSVQTSGPGTLKKRRIRKQARSLTLGG